MAAEKVVFDVEYTEFCQACEQSGNMEVATGLCLERGGIVCAKGIHKDEQVTGVHPTQKAAERPAAKPAKLNSEGAFRPGVHSVAKEEIPTLGESGPTVAEIERLPEPAEEPEAEHVRVSNPRALEGGDLEITLRIPDRHVAAVKAEAEVQRQPVEEYLQTWIEHALDNFWGR
ncbi:MAG TPA: hypothetical protein VFY05_04715 [Candidatus Angelobacter sp.]|nr:hypothetical protein [Candidatus Angelobacter sp.]